MQKPELNEKYYINMINNICVELHNRCNGAVEEILRGRDGKDEFMRMIDSLRYVLDDKENIVKK